MYRRPRALPLLVGSLGAALLLGAPRPATATNILLIVLDDLGSDKVSAYADERYPGHAPTYLPDTPVMDTLARVGLRFSDAYANPVCSPTRASLLTGRYPFQHQVGDIMGETTPELPTSTTTLAELLTETAPGGYESAVFGKWHLGMVTPEASTWPILGEYTAAPNPALHGFDAYAGDIIGLLEEYYDWKDTRWPAVLTDGSTGTTVSMNTTWAPDVTVSDTIDWVSDRAGPWFVEVALDAPHFDRDGTPDSWESGDLAPEDAGFCLDQDADGACSSIENLSSLVVDADRRVAALLDGLAAVDPGTLEDTVIVLLGDNGTPKTGLEAPWTPSGERDNSGKESGYESGVLVPFLMARGCDWMDQSDGVLDGRYEDGSVACTGTPVLLVTPGLTISAPVQVEDVYATVAGLAGATGEVPAASWSLVPCLGATSADAVDCGNDAWATRAIYGEVFRRPYTKESGYGLIGPADTGTAAIKRAPLKIIATINRRGTSPCMDYESFDLSTDPYENDNLREGGNVLSDAQAEAYISLWLTLREEIAPDWFVARDCAGDSPWDLDHDTYEDAAYGGVDCDDTDPDSHPDATDTWYDGVDSNCDGGDDYDQDLDGAQDPSGGGADCDDLNPALHPGAVEHCDGVDEDCDGFVDDDAVEATTTYTDGDGDGVGDAAVVSCDPVAGTVAVDGDCDDADAAVHPGAEEVCDDAGVDEDCDGTANGGCDTATDTGPGEKSPEGCGCVGGGSAGVPRGAGMGGIVVLSLLLASRRTRAGLLPRIVALATLAACSGDPCGPGTEAKDAGCVDDSADTADSGGETGLDSETDTSGETDTDTDTDTAIDTDTGETADPCTLAPSIVSIDAAAPADHPLTRDVRVTLTQPVPLAMACVNVADPAEVHYQESPAAVNHAVAVTGLLSASSYHCAAAPLCPDATVSPVTLDIQTETLDSRFPPLHVEMDPERALAGGPYTLTNIHTSCESDSTGRLLIFDPDGQLRWYHELPDRMNSGLEARSTGNGSIVWGGGSSSESAAERLNLLGEVEYKVTFPGADREVFHHDGKQLADGRLMTLTESTVDYLGTTRTGFVLRTHPIGSEVPDWQWESETAVSAGTLPGGAGDVYHANWMDLLDTDDGLTAYVSLCAVDLVLAIDVASGAVRWTFGPGGDFTLVDATGRPLRDSEYPQCQHGLDVDGDRVILYDNGWERGYTRVAQYTLDATTRVATEDWVWAGDDWFEQTLGDADWLPDDHFLVTKAHPECLSASPGAHSEIVEVDRPTGEVVWRLTFDEITTSIYRAQRIDGCEIFDDVRYCPAVAEGFDAARGILGL